MSVRVHARGERERAVLTDRRGNMSTTAAAQLNNNEEPGLNGKPPSIFLQGKLGRDPNVALKLLYVGVAFFSGALKRCYATSIVSLRSMTGISSSLVGEGERAGRRMASLRESEWDWMGAGVALSLHGNLEWLMERKPIVNSRLSSSAVEAGLRGCQNKAKRGSEKNGGV